MKDGAETDSFETHERNFEGLVREISANLENEIKDHSKLRELINGKTLERSDTKFNKKPEDLTEQVLIEPILDRKSVV